MSKIIGVRTRLAAFIAIFLPTLLLRAADQFGDVTVSAAAMYTGTTYHGYASIQVALENRSTDRAHVVTLTYPNNDLNHGNSIGRLSRTVKLEPEEHEMVLLLQPPLPANGDGNIRVEIDNRHEGEVHAPNANNHCNSYYNSSVPAVVFVSRTLDFDTVERVYNAEHGGFTAEMAVGASDSSGYGLQPTEWVPDTRLHGQTNWLELDYASPQIVDKVVIYTTQPPSGTGTVSLIGTSGTNVLTIPMSAGVRGSGQVEFSFTATTEAIRTVRLEYGKALPYTIAVDAVGISDPTKSQWASAARASSDNSASASGYRSGSSEDTITSLRGESPVSEWSENWLAYTPFDAVVLSVSDLNSMTPAVLTALGDYLSAGGTIVLPGENTLPTVWHSYGQKKLKDGTEYTVGFGHCFVLSEDPGAFDKQTVQTLRTTALESVRYWRGLPNDDTAANAAMPVVQNLKIPARGIVIVMVAFIIIIGPANLIYLSRRNRRTWMLWTIPAISFVTTLLVFAYSLLREGITPDTRIVGLTLIDQNTHHATTVGGSAFYCPLTPSGGLHFEYAAEATPLVNIGYGSGVSREVDWTQSQHFSRGWVSARVPAHFHLRKSGAGRERIQVVLENGRPTVINGLGAPVKSLWYADANMNLYSAENIPAGQKNGLLSAKPSEPLEKTGPIGLMRELGYTSNPDAVHAAERYLLPNTYIAVLDGNPFIENGLGSAARAKRTRASSVVFGILETPEAP